MSKKEEIEPKRELGINDLKVIEQKLEQSSFGLSQRLESVAQYSLETRTQSVLSSHSLELLLYNFEEHVAEKFALRQSLLDVEAELSKRRQSQEAAVRRAASYGDRLAYINRFIDDIIGNQRATADKNVALNEELRTLKIRVDAQQKTIENFSGIVQYLKNKAEKKQMPQDQIAELKTIAPEIFAARPAPTLMPTQPYQGERRTNNLTETKEPEKNTLAYDISVLMDTSLFLADLKTTDETNNLMNMQEVMTQLKDMPKITPPPQAIRFSELTPQETSSTETTQPQKTGRFGIINKIRRKLHSGNT